MKIETFSHNDADKLVDEKIRNQVIKTIESTKFLITKGCADELRKIVFLSIS